MSLNNIIQVGNRLKDLRKKHNLTQAEMADKLNLARSTYANYESNKREPSEDVLKDIANIFNIDIFDLVYDSNKLKYELQEIEIFDNFLMSLGYKFNLLCNDEGDICEIELKNLRTNTSKYLTEEEFESYKRRIKNFIDFEFYNMK